MTKDEEKQVTALQEVMKKSLFKAMSRKKYTNDLRTVKILKDGHDQFYIVYDEKAKEEVDWNYIKAKNWTRMPTESLVHSLKMPVVPVYITDSFWTCDCNVGYIHHHVLTKCPICKLTFLEDTEKIPKIQTHLVWRL